MDRQDKFDQPKFRRRVERNDLVGPNKGRRNDWLINRPIVMPGTGGALLVIGEGTVVMMNRCENRAHAQVEQANDRSKASHHDVDAQRKRALRACASEKGW